VRDICLYAVAQTQLSSFFIVSLHCIIQKKKEGKKINKLNSLADMAAHNINTDNIFLLGNYFHLFQFEAIICLSILKKKIFLSDLKRWC
jgi:hypothetical protein